MANNRATDSSALKVIFAAMRNLFLTVALMLFLGIHNGSAQANVRDSLLNISMVMPSGAFHIPQKDLANRFGNFATVGLSFLRKTKSGFLWGADAFFIFGQTVKEKNMIDAITTQYNYLIGGNGTLYDVRYYMRGYKGELKVGQLWSWGKPNRNSGIYTTAGFGFIQHKIRLDPGRNSDTPQLNKTYMKGYDRLSNGFSLTPAIGYFWLGNRRLVNFFIQAEYGIGFTQNRRSWNYDLNASDNTKRIDGMLGFRAGWILPLYKKTPNDYYFY